MVGLTLFFSKKPVILGSNLKELLKKKYYFRLLWILNLKDILQLEHYFLLQQVCFF